MVRLQAGWLGRGNWGIHSASIKGKKRRGGNWGSQWKCKSRKLVSIHLARINWRVRRGGEEQIRMFGTLFEAFLKKKIFIVLCAYMILGKKILLYIKAKTQSSTSSFWEAAIAKKRCRFETIEGNWTGISYSVLLAKWKGKEEEEKSPLKLSARIEELSEKNPLLLVNVPSHTYVQYSRGEFQFFFSLFGRH